ncbi:hypothetical protein NQ315_012393 [Exocentrus adspersus]|uniref:Uncharacterized protein n=1 Tax=Exocentrus adspersus TaxID=1586481 RepID=A0AAV8VMC8_9CUCU|nr:hypothetical protein NQ315_012393 [Exocentrus adspersus]
MCKVLANGKYSHSFTVENGVPQGSVLSTTLFILAMKDICKTTRSPVKYALYADDLILYCAGKNTGTTCRLLQNSVNDLSQWSKVTGFNFSASKSKIMKFSRNRNNVEPHVTLNNIPLQIVPYHKILGLTFDSRLVWKQHIQEVKKSCWNRINILKALSHHHWGAEEEALLRIYKSLIRSKLDYGSIVFSTASKSVLKTLDTVHNTSLRICLGAFRSSPVESLYCESNELPLSLRREQLLLTYSTTVSATPSNPVFSIFSSIHDVLPHSPRHLLSIGQILKPLLYDINLTRTTPYPVSSIPPWKKILPSVDISLSKYNKYDTPNILIKQAFKDLIKREHFENILYTDASKNENGCSCSVILPNFEIVKYRLPHHCSIHTGELYGILMALKTITGLNKVITICTDSLSSVESIGNIYSQNALVEKIHEVCHQLDKQKISITIVWVPSHVGIAGNEKADQAAKEALSSNLPEEDIQLRHDIKNALKQSILNKWKIHWSQSNTKLAQIHPNLIPIKPPALKRRDKIIIRRLRIGHTRYTHGYLMAGATPPSCELCNKRLSVYHILIECPQYAPARQLHNLPGNLKEVLQFNSSKKSSSIYWKPGTDIRDLPPTDNAFKFHIRRAFLQCAIYKTAHLVRPNIPDIIQFGRFKKDGNISPVTTTLNASFCMFESGIPCSDFKGAVLRLLGQVPVKLGIHNSQVCTPENR